MKAFVAVENQGVILNSKHNFRSDSRYKDRHRYSLLCYSISAFLNWLVTTQTVRKIQALHHFSSKPLSKIIPRGACTDWMSSLLYLAAYHMSRSANICRETNRKHIQCNRSPRETHTSWRENRVTLHILSSCKTNKARKLAYGVT